MKDWEISIRDSAELVISTMRVASDYVDSMESELTLLRKVADAARGVAGFDPCHDANSYWSIKKLSNALDEYDKAKEGQDGKSI